MKKIRVLIIEDSPVIRQFLGHVIACDPRLEVAGAVESGEEALRILEKASPDVISLDIRLPGMNGFEVTRRIMRERPTPIVVVSASVECADLQITMNALQEGALAVLEKPPGVGNSAAGRDGLPAPESAWDALSSPSVITSSTCFGHLAWCDSSSAEAATAS